MVPWVINGNSPGEGGDPNAAMTIQTNACPMAKIFLIHDRSERFRKIKLPRVEVELQQPVRTGDPDRISPSIITHPFPNMLVVWDIPGAGPGEELFFPICKGKFDESTRLFFIGIFYNPYAIGV